MCAPLLLRLGCFHLHAGMTQAAVTGDDVCHWLYAGTVDLELHARCGTRCTA
jgi:hypothetical protein